MPTLPSVDGPLPVAQSQRRIVGYDATQLTRANAQAGQAIGGAIEQAASKFQQEHETALIMDAESQLSDWKLSTLFDESSGVYARKGKNALGAAETTLSAFERRADELSKGLQTPAAKARWGTIISHQRKSLGNELSRYEYGERQNYQDQAAEGQISAAMQGAKLYYKDPQQVAYYQNKMNAVLGAQAQRKGLPPELADQHRLTANSALSAEVIARMAADDPFAAQEYYAKNSSGMTAEDQVKIGNLLGPSVRKRMADDIASGLWSSGSTGASGLTAAVIQAESGGKADAVSPKGARGLMQLMPGTAKEMAGELGLPYDEARLTSDPNYNMALGKAYLNKMLTRYGGHEALAVAAYNAGPGAVDEWLESKGDPRKGEISLADWIERIPFQETRDYTAKVIGATQQRAPASVKYAEALSAVNQIADPDLRDLTKDRLEDFQKAQKAKQDALYDQAAQVVNDSGFNELPPQMISQLQPDDLGKLRKLDRQRREGIEPVTDYEKLESMLSMSPGKLAELSLERDIRPHLDNADFNTVRGAWQAARKGDGMVQGVAKNEMQMLGRVMNIAGVLTGDSKDAKTPENLQKRQQFLGAYRARLDSYRLKTGNDPDLTERESLAEDLLLDVRLSGGGRLFGDSSARPLWEVPPEQLSDTYLDKGSVSVSQVPARDRYEIVQALRSNGRPASEANIVAEYLNRKAATGVRVR